MDLTKLSREEMAKLLEHLLARETSARQTAKQTSDDHVRTVHELEIYQLELEMQNRELRETQLELERSHARFEQLYAFAPVAYLTLAADGAVVSMNAAASQLLECAVDAAAGQSFVQLTAMSEPVYFQSLLQRCAEHGFAENAEFELHIRDKSLFVEVALTPVAESSSGSEAFRCALLDRTGRRRSELARERLHEVERTLHNRFELLDQVTFAINRALVSAERSSFETVVSVVVDAAFALLKPNEARIVITPEYNGGRGLEVRRVEPRAAGEPVEASYRAQAQLVVGNRRVGELHISFGERALVAQPSLARTLALLAERVALALEVARLNEFERRERARLDMLAKAHAELSQAPDGESTLASVGRAVALSVPQFARCSLLFTCEHGGQWKLLGHSHEQPRATRALSKLRHALESALAAAQTAGVEATHEDRIVDLATEPALRKLALQLQLSTLITLPLRAGEQRLGLICFGCAESMGALDASTMRPLRELAASCAGALERARLLEELRTAVSSRDTLLEIVSHDLRSPLSAIQMTARVLGRPHDDDEHRRSAPQIDLIQRSVARMSHLVEDLLSAGNMDAGQFALELGEVDPCATLREALQLNEPAIHGNGLRSELDCAPNLPAVSGDRQRLLQALTNLISNAVKFTPRGGKVCVGASLSDGHVRFCVSDTGHGIPSHLVAQVFVRYWTGHTKRSGLGLGLYIAERIVQAHGGRIWAESSLGKGASFYFTIPVMDQTGRRTPESLRPATSLDNRDAATAS